jgi:hypothetical protein
VGVDEVGDSTTKFGVMYAKESLFEDPEPAFNTKSLVELAIIEFETCCGVRPGLFEINLATIPATFGAAIDVPLIVFTPVKPSQVEVIELPGANKSRQLPKLE